MYYDIKVLIIQYIFLPFKQGVRGSNPRRSTKGKTAENTDISSVSAVFFLLYLKLPYTKTTRFNPIKYDKVVYKVVYAHLINAFSFLAVCSRLDWRMWV